MGGTSKVILGMVVGGMMSVDMGGPVNKAAYVFGTAQLAEGNFDVMAAVMAGGMVPPLAIALANHIFQKEIHGKRASVRSCKLYYGFVLHLGGSYPVCCPGSVARDSILYCRLSRSRRSVHAPWLYAQGAARRYLCSSDNRESNRVPGGRGGRICSGVCDSRGS